MKNIKYTVVVPAYCEEKVIADSLQRLSGALKNDSKRFKVTEVIVVAADGGDKTAQIARYNQGLFANFVLIEPGKKVGKGRDVREGVLAARGEYVLFLDADLATPPHHIVEAFDGLEQNNIDLLIARRPLSKIHNTISRKVFSVLANLLVRFLATPGIQDSQCGFKAFKTMVAKQLFKPLETMGWGFDIEILARARAKKLKIETLKIDDWYDPKEDVMGLVGESNMHAYLNTLKELFIIAARRLLGRYR